MFNKLTLIGRIGKDPEARGTQGNVCALDVATTNFYVRKDGVGVEETEWTACVGFGRLAESILKQAKKGDLVLVEGMKKSDVYEKDGKTRTSVFLQMDTFRRLSWNSATKPVEAKVAEEKVVLSKPKKNTKEVNLAN